MSSRARTHRYVVQLDWAGATTSYAGYSRNHVISAPGRPDLAGSADPAFNGDASRWNPEQLLVAAISACHKLWYLHLCAEAGVIVTRYADAAEGMMAETAQDGGAFTQIVLRPVVTLAPGSDGALALRLHDRAHELCFIARSVAFLVRHEARLADS